MNDEPGKPDTGYIRLRQICLVALHLEPVITDIAVILGLNVLLP